MGIYSTKFKLESAVDVAVQDPDNVGNDLDQIEKNIMGPDGIEAHRDEVNAAEDGLIGDPIEEMYFAVYESEYNYNQIMEAIGIAELREAQFGREIVYEAADKEGFFAKVKQWLSNLFESISKAFAKVVSALDFEVRTDKKFIAEHEKDIREGFSKDWSVAGYLFSDLKFSDINFDGAKEYVNKCRDALNDVYSDGKLAQKAVDFIYDHENDKYKADIIKSISGIDTNSADEMRDKLTKKLFGGEKYENLKTSGLKVDAIIDILKNDREAKAIRALYSDIKKSFKKSLSEIDELKKKAANQPKEFTDEAKNKSFEICTYACNFIKFEKQISNTVYGIYIKAARTKRNQARKLAHAFAKAAGATAAADTEVQHNSAIGGSIFSRVAIV